MKRYLVIKGEPRSFDRSGDWMIADTDDRGKALMLAREASKGSGAFIVDTVFHDGRVIWESER